MNIGKGCGIVLLVGALGLGLIGYCGYTMVASLKAEMPIIEGEVKVVVGRFNAEEFAAIYKDADAQLQAGISEVDFVKNMKDIKVQFDELILGPQVGFNMNTVNGDTTLTCSYDVSKDASKRTAVFTFHKTDAWRLLGLNIQQSL